MSEDKFIITLLFIEYFEMHTYKRYTELRGPLLLPSINFYISMDTNGISIVPWQRTYKTNNAGGIACIYFIVILYQHHFHHILNYVCGVCAIKMF